MSETDGWTLTATEPTPELLYLANGYLGTSLSWDCGLLTEQEESPCYIRGVYDNRGPGGVDRLAEIPCWHRIRYGTEARLTAYSRSLDLRHGTLRTTLELAEERGTLALEHTIFLSRADPHIAAVRIEVTPGFDGDLAFTLRLAPGPDRGLVTLDARAAGRELVLRTRSETYGIEIEQGQSVLEQEWAIEGSSDGGDLRSTVRTRGEQGRTTTLTIVAHIATPPTETESATASPPYDDLRREHEAAWERLWETEIEVEGDPEVQQFARAGLFYLWSTMLEGDEWSIAPMGLSGNFYNGHVFWDAELWMYPSLLLTQPAMAKSCVAYRKRTIEPARRRAAANGRKGAQYPWEAAYTGEEMTPTWAETRDFQLHITADVAIGQWWYYLVTQDLGWLRTDGYPVIHACAEYWQSRVEYRQEADRYEISDVVCADEYAAHVNNDAFTNAAVQQALRIATRAAELLGEPAPHAWREIADRMYIPYDERSGIHLEYDGFDGRVTKQADVELLAFPLEYTTDRAQVARDLDAYAGVIDPHGPAMSFSIYSIVSAQLGRLDDAYTYLKRSYAPNTRPPFFAFSETPVNDEYFFCTGVGGALQSLLFGFTGIRLREGYVRIDPILPAHWTALRLRGLYLAGARTDIEIEPESVTVRRYLNGDTVEARIDHRSGAVELDGGNTGATIARLLVDGVETWRGTANGSTLSLPTGTDGEIRVQLSRDSSRPLLDVGLPQLGAAIP